MINDTSRHLTESACRTYDVRFRGFGIADFAELPPYESLLKLRSVGSAQRVQGVLKGLLRLPEDPKEERRIRSRFSKSFL